MQIKAEFQHFFRVEELSEPIFDTIQHLADKHLGITPQFLRMQNQI